MDIMETKILELEKELKRTKAELWLLHEISNVMRSTLNLPEILYIILSAVTSHDGLGFNRAMLFLVSKDRRMIEGTMAIGPTDAEEASRAWKTITEQNLGLNRLVEMFRMIENHVVNAPLNNAVKEIQLPLVETSGILATSVLEGMNFEAITPEIRQKIHDETLGKLNVAEFICVPLKGKNQVQGVLIVDNYITKKLISRDDIRVLSMFAGQAGLAIDNAQLYEDTKFKAHTDSLTRLWNHGYFQNALTELLQETNDAQGTLSLAMIDLDNFKSYNYIQGHQKGDVALREIAFIFKSRMRTKDLVCRYGGEEFAIIMPGIDKAAALSIIERLRVAVEETFLRLKKDASLPPITISAGIAQSPQDANSKESLIEKADVSLYKAKKTGKNKIVLFSEDTQ